MKNTSEGCLRNSGTRHVCHAKKILIIELELPIPTEKISCERVAPRPDPTKGGGSTKGKGGNDVPQYWKQAPREGG